jgi:hypothetical protein
MCLRAGRNKATGGEDFNYGVLGYATVEYGRWMFRRNLLSPTSEYKGYPEDGGSRFIRHVATTNQTRRGHNPIDHNLTLQLIFQLLL